MEWWGSLMIAFVCVLVAHFVIFETALFLRQRGWRSSVSSSLSDRGTTGPGTGVVGSHGGITPALVILSQQQNGECIGHLEPILFQACLLSNDPQVRRSDDFLPNGPYLPVASNVFGDPGRLGKRERS